MNMNARRSHHGMPAEFFYRYWPWPMYEVGPLVGTDNLVLSRLKD